MHDLSRIVISHCDCLVSDLYDLREGLHFCGIQYERLDYTPILKIVVRAECNKQEADDRKGHWDFLLTHLFIRRHFDNMHFQMAK